MPRLWLRILLLTPFVLAVLGGMVSGAPVTRIVRQHRDVTGDGRLDEIVLRVTGKSVDQPYAWTLTIRSAGRTILTYHYDDTAIDTLFHKVYTTGENVNRAISDQGGSSHGRFPWVRQGGHDDPPRAPVHHRR
jgi:hypothetical protein